MQTTWLDLTYDQAGEAAKKFGLPAFRGRQIWQWLHQKIALSYDEMTNLPLDMRREWAQRCPITQVRVERRQQSKEDGTVKYLFALEDDSLIESVLMRYQHGYTVCVSSQVGCRMGCRFCASTLDGLKRNLTPGEMLQQVYRIEREEKVSVSHVVVMGCGEPFDNYDNVLAFLRILHDPKGQGMSFRNMTVSTCGLMQGLERWTEDALPVTLAISLHAPNDSIRKTMMPVAKSVSMEDLLAACKAYVEKTNRRITFEYALVRGVNDRPEQAEELAHRLRGLLCHVNLIPVNPVDETALRSPDITRVKAFEAVLQKHHIPVTVRRGLGRDIDGACGQLRRRYKKETEADSDESSGGL